MDSNQVVALKLAQERAEIVAKYDRGREGAEIEPWKMLIILFTKSRIDMASYMRRSSHITMQLWNGKSTWKLKELLNG